MTRGEPAANSRLAGCWLAAWQALVTRAAHDVNGALNAVAMNVEVARLRAAPGADAGRVAAFAEGAATAHADTVELVTALIALGRAPRHAGVDVGDVTRAVVALLAPGVRPRGGTLTLDAPTDHGVNWSSSRHPTRTGAPVDAVRLATTAVLLAATAELTAFVRCRLEALGEPSAAVRLRIESPAPVVLDAEVTAVLREAGIGWDPATHILAFPRE